MPSEQINKSLVLWVPEKNGYTGPGAAELWTTKLYDGGLVLEGEELHLMNSLHIQWSTDTGSVSASIQFKMQDMADYVDEWRKSAQPEDPMTNPHGDRGSVSMHFNDRAELTKLAEIAKRARTKAYGA